MELDNRKAEEVILRSFRELILIIPKANSIRTSVDSFALALVLLIQRAEPVEVFRHHIEQSSWEVRESGARVQKAHIECCTPIHEMIVN